MIRPFTLICMLLACGSGLYLYQTKHRVRLLDRDIAQTVQATTAARDRAGVLRTEWTLLNDLERLRQLADQHMRLRPVAPGQFTSLAELAGRLPPPRAPAPEPAAAPVLQPEAAPALAETTEPMPEMADLPTPPLPPPAMPPPGIPRAPAPSMQVASASSGSIQNAANPAAARPGRAAAEANHARAVEHRQVAEAILRPQPAPMVRAAVAVATSAFSPPQASSLGMAARTMLPPPVPVSAAQFMSPN